jgi:DNA-binding PadR family transcriptional regulator
VVSTPLALLGLLSRGPRHGYDLKREHDDRFPAAKPLAYGQVYATLGRLLRDGLVEVTEQQPGDGPERTVYALTEKGRRQLGTWVTEPEPPAPHVANVLYTKVLLSLIAGGDASAYLDVQRSAHLARMRELTDQRRRASLPEALADDYALFHLEADLRWLQVTADRLSALMNEVSA